MNGNIESLYRRIKELEEELEVELARAAEALEFHFERGRVRFNRQVALAHRRMRQSLYRYLRGARLLNILTAPVILALIVPLAALDLCVTVYQFICFPVYGIRKVPRSDFITLDRHHLEYLNAAEKFNCVYCGYANGLFAWLREVGARTEEYWCPIKHARRIRNPHSRYANFVAYGDAAGYRGKLDAWYKKNK
ncbi:MAG: hypothetical protein HY804_14115 [Nitrospinae bacterium]|nr:hypothetical protein [Nitrospinota bacterium]